jgi:hypothetical protein
LVAGVLLGCGFAVPPEQRLHGRPEQCRGDGDDGFVHEDPRQGECPAGWAAVVEDNAAAAERVQADEHDDGGEQNRSPRWPADEHRTTPADGRGDHGLAEHGQDDESVLHLREDEVATERSCGQARSQPVGDGDADQRERCGTGESGCQGRGSVNGSSARRA